MEILIENGKTAHMFDFVNDPAVSLSRGLLARSTLQAQAASPIFTHVYAAVLAIINSKFPQIGELILKRIILNFRKGYRRNDKVRLWEAGYWFLKGAPV